MSNRAVDRIFRIRLDVHLVTEYGTRGLPGPIQGTYLEETT